MAVTAKFQADFSDFLRKAQQAGDSLEALQTAAGSTTTSVQRLATGFSGERIMRGAADSVEAVKLLGGTAKLTDTEVQRLASQLNEATSKMARMGVTVPAEMQKMQTEANAALRKLDDGVKTTGSMFGGLGSSIVAATAGFFTAQAALAGIKSAFGFAKDAAIGMNASLEKSTLQFGTLMGDTKRAEAHVRDLFEFAKRTPFETGPIITASRHMQTFGGDSLNTMANLELLGDAAAATGAPIEDLGFWVGRMYAAMKGGQPFGEATMRLMELGVLTPQVRAQMDSLSKSAGGGEKAFGVFQDSLKNFSGAMVAQAGTWDGLMSSISDAINITLADALHPFFEAVKDGAGMILKVLGSEGTQKVFNQLKADLTNAFGNDSGATIKGLSHSLIVFAEISTVVAEGVHRAWSGLKLVFAGTASLVGSLMLGMQSMATTMIETAAKSAANLPGIGEKLAGIAAQSRLMTESLRTSQKGFHDMAQSALDGVTGGGAFAATMSAARTALDGMRNELEATSFATDKATAAITKKGGATGAGTVKTKEQIKAEKEAEKALLDLAHSFWQVGEKQDDAVSKAQAYYAQLDRLKLFTPITALATTFGFSMDKLNTSINNSAASYVGYTGNVNAAKKALEEKNKVANETAATWDKLEKAAKQIGPALVKAFQGGGDAFKSLGSTLGLGLGEDLGEKLANKIGGKLGSTLGGMMGPLGAAAGALLGKGIDKGIGWIKGLFSDPMKKEIEESRKEIDKLKAKLLEHGGDLEGIEAQYNAMGLSIKEAWAGQGKQGIAALDAAMKLFADRVKEAKEQLAGLEDELKASTDDLNALIESADEFGYVFDKSGQFVGYNFDVIAKKAKDLGVDFGALGGAFQQANITGRSQEIIDAFHLMTSAGGDVGGVLFGIKDEIGAIVGDSIKFGTTIPANMKPWVEELIRTGQLTDENGNKIHDLTGIKFGEPVKTQYEQINDSIKNVLDKMSELMTKIADLAGAIAAATAPRTVQIGWSVAPRPNLDDESSWQSNERAAMGGGVGAFGIQRFARGGIVGGMGEGDVVPAMLTPGEGVLSRRGMQALAKLNHGGSVGNDPALRAELRGLREEAAQNARTMRDLPRAIGLAVKDAMVLA